MLTPPWVKYCQYSNEWGMNPPTPERKIELIDDLLQHAVEDGAEYMNQESCWMLEGAVDAMCSQYMHMEDYGLFSKDECHMLFKNKLQQIRRDPIGNMEFFKASHARWGNPAYVVAFYFAIAQKQLPAERVVYEVSLPYTSKEFSYPVDSEDEEEEEELDKEMQPCPKKQKQKP